MFFVWVEPANDECGVSLIRCPLHKRIFFTQIQNVKLINPRWHNQKRHIELLLGSWLIMNELEHLVLVNDLTLGGGNIFPQLKGCGVRHTDT